MAITHRVRGMLLPTDETLILLEGKVVGVAR